MYEAEFITKDDYEKAIDYDIVADFTEPKKSPSEKYPRLTEELERRAKDILLSVVAEEDGYTMEDLNNNEQLTAEYEVIDDHDLRMGGNIIPTTVNKNIYDKKHDIITNHYYCRDDRTSTKKDK